MASTTPNKEIVRRVCHMLGATYCYLLVDTGDVYAEVLTDIEDDKVLDCQLELESWCGMKFKTYNSNGNVDHVAIIQKNGEMILPIKI